MQYRITENYAGGGLHARFLIADLFGNTSVKYRQEDDTLALAVKTGGGHGGEGGGWHMMGDVVPSPDEALVGQVRGLRQILDFFEGHKKSVHPTRSAVHVWRMLCHKASRT